MRVRPDMHAQAAALSQVRRSTSLPNVFVYPLLVSMAYDLLGKLWFLFFCFGGHGVGFFLRRHVAWAQLTQFYFAQPRAPAARATRIH